MLARAPIVRAMNTRTKGFTLLELMLVLVIFGILVGVGVPAMGNFFRNARMSAAANDLLAAMYVARTEAIKRRTPVTLCTSTNPNDADPACGATDVLNGWFVFVDNNNNGQWDDDWTFDDIDGDGFQDVEETDGPDADTVWTANQPDEDIDDDGNQDVAEPDVAEVVLYRHDPLPATISARASANPLALTYLASGFTQGGGGGRLVMCDARGNIASGGELSAARGITVSVTGRPNITRNPDEIEALMTLLGGTVGGCSS